MKNVQSWNSFKKFQTNNLPLSEKKRVEKRVRKLHWKFMSDDERMDALLSVVKDPDEAGKYIELDWDDLPARINPQNMRVFEKSGIVNEAAKTQFTKPGKDGQPAKDGDIYFSKREGNAIAVKRGDVLQSVYVYDGQPKLGKIHKTDKRWENMGPLSRGLLTDLTAKGVGGLYTRKVAAEDAKILLQFLSDMTESVNEDKVNERLNVSRDALNKVYKELGATDFAQMILKLRDENALDDLVDALSNEYPRIMR
tara:strand:- start:6436 stop:7194 length:759 start_codon:yes stop_codon:yes gene_type:complete